MDGARCEIRPFRASVERARPSDRPRTGQQAAWLVALSRAFSPLRASLACAAVGTRRRRALSRLRAFPGGAWRVLNAVHAARTHRRLLKIFAGRGSSRFWPSVLMEEEARGPAVIAIFRSPWDFVAARALAASRGILVFANATAWGPHLGSARLAPGFGSARRAVAHLRAGGRVAAVADRFHPRGRPVTFLDLSARVDAAPVRLAAAGRVPLVPATIAFRAGAVRVSFGQPIAVGRDRRSRAEALDALLARFERAVIREPAGWRCLLSFLRRNAK